VQTREYASPLRRKEALDVSPEDGQHYKLREGEKVRVTSRRGSLVAPVHFDSALRPGLAFLSVHDHDQVATNELTIDAVDPKSGTSEFKATAIRIEKV
jgi:anaerobic selenocysteine-containing dehydrogenase